MPLDPEINDLAPLSKRALRRHHRQRVIEHARLVVRRWSLSFDETKRKATRLHDHLAFCSCCLCRNPRRTTGERTLQEIRVDALPLRGGCGRVEDGD